jgi:hypothetical protein
MYSNLASVSQKRGPHGPAPGQLRVRKQAGSEREPPLSPLASASHSRNPAHPIPKAAQAHPPSNPIWPWCQIWFIAAEWVSWIATMT